MQNWSRWQQTTCRLAGIVAALSLVSACSGIPPIEETETVSLYADFPGFINLQVDVDGDPELRPGSMAMGGLEAAGDCQELVIFCAILTVPLAAATGATITAIETLPEADAHELNRVSADVMASLNQSRLFEDAMRAAAARRDVALTSSRADVYLNVHVTDFHWDVSVGNRVGIKLKFVVLGEANGKKGRRKFTIVGNRAKPEVWTADNGKLIRSEFLAQLNQASEQIWGSVLAANPQ